MTEKNSEFIEQIILKANSAITPTCEIKVKKFQEKPEGDGLWINGGFFVMEPGIFDYLQGDMDDIQWEKKPLLEIAQDGQLAAYRHHGFWKPMDALRDRIELEGLWNSGKSPWKVW